VRSVVGAFDVAPRRIAVGVASLHHTCTCVVAAASAAESVTWGPRPAPTSVPVNLTT